MVNAMENNGLASLAQRAAPAVVNAIKNAAHRTGVNFAYLMEQAAVESSFRPDAKARTSSASGLYQFIERTWMGMVRDHGDKYGLDKYADQIDARGRVRDPALRREILALRNDPEVASLMAGEFAADNKRYLERFGDKIGEIGATELYMAHFLGAGGAASFLRAHKETPLAVAADLMPAAARANYNVFYNSKTGKSRTVAEVYDYFDNKFTASKQETQFAQSVERNAGQGSARTGSLGMESFLRLTADDDVAPKARSAPLLPQNSPFAHLNQRRDEGSYREAAAREIIRPDMIRWNQPRMQVAALAPPLANPAQVMLMAERTLRG